LETIKKESILKIQQEPIPKESKRRKKEVQKRNNRKVEQRKK